MNLTEKRLLPLFFVSFLLTCLGPHVLVKLNFFAPFLILLIYQKTEKRSLWGALGCGLLIDLLSLHTKMGMHALTFTLTTAILYRQKKHFFADSPTTLPLMTYFFSVLSNFQQGVFIQIFDKPLTVSIDWMARNLVLYPALDGACAFVLYILPFALFGKPIRKGKDYFLNSER